MNKPMPTARWQKLLRFAGYTFFTLLVLVLGLVFALSLPAVQQRLAREAATFLAGKLGTRVEVGTVRLAFPHYISLERFLVEDQQGDTLARVGNLTVSLDMWQLLSQTIELQKITLEDASVYLHQKDSIYNFDFAVKAFANPDQPVAADTSGSAWKLGLDMTLLQLRQVRFLLEDEDTQSTTFAGIGSAQLVLTTADLKNLNFEVADVRLANSDIRLIAKQKSTSASPVYGIWLKNGEVEQSHIVYETPEMAFAAHIGKTRLDALQLSSGERLGLQASGITVENTAVIYRDPVTPPTPGHFNAGDLDMTQLQAQIPRFLFQQDTLQVSADQLSGTDKSGVTIHEFQGTVQVTPGSISLQQLLTRVNRTSVDGDILLFKNNQAVFDRVNIRLRQAKGIVGDLIVLLPPQENTTLQQLSDIPYQVSGGINGHLDRLALNNLLVQAGSGTVASVTGTVQNATDMDKLGVGLTIKEISSNRADLVRWMSLGTTPADSLLAQPLPAWFKISGFAEGNLSSLNLQLSGDAGQLQSGPLLPAPDGQPLHVEVSGTLTDVNQPDKTGLNITITQLDAPNSFFAFLETPDLQMPDLVQVTGTVSGTLDNLQSDLKILAHRAGMTSNLAVKGWLKNLSVPEQLGFDMAFNGGITRPEILGYIPDTLLTRFIHLPQVTSLDGFAKGTVKDATGALHINLGKQGLLQLNGTLLDTTYQLHLTGQNLLAGQIAVDSALQPLQVVSFTADVTGEGFQWGNSARAQLAGQFDSIIWDNLILRHITFNGDIDGQRFNAGLQSTDDRANVLFKASGDFSTAVPILDADLSLQCIDLRAFGWSNRPTTACLHLIAHTEGISIDSLDAVITIKDIDLQYDTVHIRPGDLALDIQLDNRNNSILVASDWLRGSITGYFNLAQLSTTIDQIADQYFVVDRTTYMPVLGTDSLVVDLHLLKPDLLVTGLIPGLTGLDPVDITGSLVAPRNYFDLEIRAPHIAYLDWQVDSLNVRAYAGDTAALFVVTAPLVKRGQQDFVENAVLNGQFRDNIAEVSFKATNDEGRERFLLEAQALLNSSTKTTIITLAPRQVVDFQAWTADPDNEIRITPGSVEVRHFLLTGNGQHIQIDGATRRLAANKTGLDFKVDIDRLNFQNFDIFIAGILKDPTGWAEAHLTIKGSTDAPQVRGKMQLHETAFTPVLTNVRYKLSETPFIFTETGIVLDGLLLTDPYDKILEIKGKLTTSDWTNIQTDLNLHADRWQALNTTKQQNPVYFGELYVSLDGTIRGPLTQPDIRVVIKTAKESSFTYVYDVATQALQHEGIVYFIQPPRQYVRPPIYDAPVIVQPFTLSASVEIDSNLTISSVIDPVTGDDFRGKATGKLQFDLFSNGNMTLAGQVELVSGVYNYSYQSVVKRSFEVASGSTIIWTGDIRTPELALKARYQFKASPYPLVVNQLSSASAEEAAAYRRPQTFYLQTTLNGSPTQPDVSFQFVYPSAEKQDNLSASFGNQQADLVEGALGNINQDKNLLSRQVFGVLLLRNFIGESVGANTSIGGSNPLQAGLSNFLTGQVNALADQYLPWVDVDLVTDNTTGQDASATNYQLRLQKSFFEDRLTFKITGGTSVGGANSDDANSALENASIEYALTPTGTFKVTVFSENGFELLNTSSGNLRNSGAGLIFTKEFGGKNNHN